MSIVETSEEGKEIVTQANNVQGQKVDSWNQCEDKNISEILSCNQVLISFVQYIIV